MIDCPDNLTLEECLKRKLKAKSKLSIQSSETIQQIPVIQKQASSLSHVSLLTMKTTSVSSPIENVSKNIHTPELKSKSNNHKTSKGSNSGGSTGFVNCDFGGGTNVSYRTNYYDKGGVVINNQSMVVKTNFEMAGRLKPDGSRPDSKSVGSHASSSAVYMDNHGNRDLDNQEELSNTYNEYGERVNRVEFNEFRKELNDGLSAFRRTVIDPGQKEFNRDDMNRLVRESMQELKEATGKNFDFKYAIHTDTQQIHAHVLSYGKNSDINLSKEQLQQFKEIVAEKSHELLLEKDRELTFNQQIDRAIDGILDNQDQSNENDLSINSKGMTL